MTLFLSFLLATLSGMGVGGGGLLILYLTLIQKMPQAEAQGINLLFFLCASATAFAVNCQKRTFCFKDTLLLAASGALMTLPGALLAMEAEPGLLRKVFGGFLLFSGFLTLWRPKR